MKKLGIVRPCKIGDLIISLPIGKYYFEQGYKIFWPIMQKYYESFKEAAGHYINFIPITNDNFFVVNSARQELENLKIKKILNLTFNTGTFSDQNSLLYKRNNLKFDEFIYKLAEVPFERKWILDIKRNKEAENFIYQKFVKNELYSVGHFDVEYNKYNWKQGEETRSKYYQKSLIFNRNENFIEIRIEKNVSSIFYWLKILEEANQLFLVDSSFANLVEGLNLKNDKYFLIRSEEKDTPTINQNWKIIK